MGVNMFDTCRATFYRRAMTAAEPTTPGRRETRRRDVQRRLEDAFLGAMAAGDPAGMTHEALADRAGISRRTAYRYFPDRESLMRSVWRRMTEAAGPGVRIPLDSREIVERLDELFTGFDRNADVMTIGLSSAEGRAVRNAMKAERTAGWRAALTEETGALPEPDRTMAVAMIQLIGSGLAWRELRDQWDLDGLEIAAACRWATVTLLKDLAARRGRPLSE